MTLVEFIVFLPLFAALAILAGSPAKATAIAAAVVNGIAALLVAIRFPLELESPVPQAFASSRRLLESPELSLAFALDGISLTLVLLTVLVTIAAVASSPADSKIKGSAKLWHVSLLLISGGALGAFCATDLFFFFAFHELALIPTFLMIGIFGRGENPRRVAWTITLYLGLGSLVVLAGLIALFASLGGQSLAFEALHALAHSSEGNPVPADTQKSIYLVLLLGFGVLVSLFPFHSWAPPAYAQAPVPVSMLHAGVLKKFGLYGLIRVAGPLLPEGAAHWQGLVLALLLGNILVIGLVTVAQRRLDHLLAYSSVMHMGYIFLGVASGTAIGLHGAVLLMFAHGLSIALLFALAGALRERTGTLDLDALGGGLAAKAPALGLLFGFAAFAAAGLPGFANFAAEIMVFFGAFKPYLDQPGEGLGMLQWVTILSLWGVVISAVYLLRAYRRVFKGPLPDSDARAYWGDLGMAERLPALLLLAALLAAGFAPVLLLRYITPAVEALAGAAG